MSERPTYKELEERIRELDNEVRGFKQIKNELRENKEKLSRSHEFLKIIFDSMNDALTVINTDDFKILKANDTFLKQLGRKGEDVLGKTCYRISHNLPRPCSLPEHPCPLEDTVKTGKFAVAEHVHYDQDGTKIYVEISTSPIKDKAGKVIQVVHLSRDVTEQKQMESLLRTQDKMSSLGRVAAGIAHEIRNPLSGINIYLTTLKKIYDRGSRLEQVREIIDQLHSASGKIESVIRRVMDFSKPSEPQLVYGNINEPVEKAIELGSISLQKSGCAFEKSLGDNLAPCPFDSVLIEQVVINLLSNAADAMKGMSNGKKIKVSTSMGMNCTLVKVIDSGPGVPVGIRGKIFDPFYTSKSDTTGIGLSICHRIITDHGGSLTVNTSEWGGAEFTINLPIDKRVR